MNLKSLAALGFAVAPGLTFAVTLYDHTIGSGFKYSEGNGDCDGGFADFGVDFGMQIAQLVTATTGGTTITEVQGNFLSFAGSNAKAVVDVYTLGGTHVGSSGIVSVTDTPFDDTVTGNVGHVVTATGLQISGLTAGNKYLVAMQSVGPHWYFLCRDGNGVAETYARDYSNFGNSGNYGTNTFTVMGDLGQANGQANMYVKAVREPTSLAVSGIVALLFLRRRQRG